MLIGLIYYLDFMVLIFFSCYRILRHHCHRGRRCSDYSLLRFLLSLHHQRPQRKEVTAARLKTTSIFHDLTTERHLRETEKEAQPRF